jgi:Animal haem peroxidase
MSTTRRDRTEARRYTRRGFLGAAGAGALGVATIGRPAILGPSDARAAMAAAASDRFSRMFSGLRPFADATPQVQDALRAIGAPGGPLDARDFDVDLEFPNPDRSPLGLILDTGPRNRDNLSFPAGTTFLGQFVDHDVSFDLTSPLGVATPPETTRNFREPALNLDSVYGVGFGDSAFVLPNGRMRVENVDPRDPSSPEDLPRTGDGTAIIVDPRNDENLMIAGLHAAFLRFHNNARDVVRMPGQPDPRALFEEARRLTRWHYQWIVLNEFLPLLVGQARVDEIRSRGRRFYTSSIAGSMPVEFQIAYRMGHSLVRPSYRANFTGNGGLPFIAFIFDPGQAGVADPDDLRGGFRSPRRFIDWQTFFPFPGFESAMRNTKRIDRTLSSALFDLPLGAIATGDPPTSLAQRNLLRHLTWQLPSGQDIARAVGAPVLSRRDLDELSGFGLGFERSTPLWYYVLAEADIVEDGLRLGPVGGKIVAEVLIGLLESDPTSFLSEPGWRPTLPAPHSGAGSFRMVDFLTFAGVDPTSRGF